MEGEESVCIHSTQMQHKQKTPLSGWMSTNQEHHPGYFGERTLIYYTDNSDG